MDADIATRLRQTRANMLGTDDEDHYYDCHEAAGEIERLRQWGRLTDAEREAVDTAEASLMRESTDLHTPLPVRQRLGAAAATLRGLLERTRATGSV